MSYIIPWQTPAYYGWGWGYRAEEVSCLQEALDLITKSVGSERADELFYDTLIAEAPSQEVKDIITSIRNDERKHREMFRQIYRDLTGQAPQIVQQPFEKLASFTEGIRRALFGELKAVETYRNIYRCLPQQGPYRDMLFEIITDELKHASKYNYIFALGGK